MSTATFIRKSSNGITFKTYKMAGVEIEGGVLNAPFDTFAKSLLPLYSGPEVLICIGSPRREYRLPKAILCTQIPYFAAMFEKDHFKEGIELSTTLEEIDGVLSPRSFEMLAQWVCLNRIVMGDLPPTEAITLSIEFARLADMYNIASLESLMAENIKRIILTSKHLVKGVKSVFARPLDENVHHLTFEHISSSVCLPDGHPVRKILASAAVKGYLLRNPQPLFKQISGLPDFAVDLLREVEVALASLQRESYSVKFEDPIDGQIINLKE